MVRNCCARRTIISMPITTGTVSKNHTWAFLAIRELFIREENKRFVAIRTSSLQLCLTARELYAFNQDHLRGSDASVSQRRGSLCAPNPNPRPAFVSARAEVEQRAQAVVHARLVVVDDVKRGSLLGHEVGGLAAGDVRKRRPRTLLKRHAHCFLFAARRREVH